MTLWFCTTVQHSYWRWCLPACRFHLPWYSAWTSWLPVFLPFKLFWKSDSPRDNKKSQLSRLYYSSAILTTVVVFKLSGHFKFFFDIINGRVTFLDAKGPIKWVCNKIRGIFLHILPFWGSKHIRGLAPLDHVDDAILIVRNKSCFWLSSFKILRIPSRAMIACRSGAWRIVAFDPHWLHIPFFALIFQKFFFHKNLGTIYTSTCFFNFQGGLKPLSQEFSRGNFISYLVIIQNSFGYTSHLPETTCKILNFVK